MLFKHRVVSNDKLNEKFILLKFKTESSGFDFKIGQYTIFKISDSVFRCYSLASLPEELPFWEIFVDITPGGPGTTYLKSLKKGQVVETLNPSGHLALDKKYNEYLFGATGCGIAPFLPMFRELVKDKKKKVFVYWGLRNEKDIVLTEYLKRYEKLNENFQYEIVLSKPKPGWKGNRGHVTEYLLEFSKNIGAKYAIYLSGSGDFVEEVCMLLKKQKFPDKNLYMERCY